MTSSSRFLFAVALATSSAASGAPGNDKVSVPPNPPPVTSIAFVCSHSDQPFGNGSQFQIAVYDLDNKIWTKNSSETPSTKDNGPPPPSKTTHAQGKIAPVKFKRLRAALAKLLAGGPYEPEYPVPEGVSCQMTLRGAQGDPFFKLKRRSARRRTP